MGKFKCSTNAFNILVTQLAVKGRCRAVPSTQRLNTRRYRVTFFRNTRYAALAAATIALTACSGQARDAELTAGNEGEPVALGLTLYQLSDADLISADGVELGEVERIVRNDAGEIVGLIIEIEDSDPDRFVQIPLAGLVSVRTGNEADDWDLQGNMTREQLARMPAYSQ